MALKQDIGIPCNNCNSCVGFKIHGWRKFCVDCKCSVENHDISDESTLSILDEMKLFDKNFYSNYQESLLLASKVHKSWLPIGLKLNEIEEFEYLLPNMCDRASEERLRKRKLRLQIPVTDRCVEKFCHLDTANERQEAEKFLVNRNNRDIGLGYVTRISDDKYICADCQITLKPNSLVVTIEHNSEPKQYWHPYCFKCTTCQELLVDYIYGCHNHKMYCVRHYAKTIRPRCGACDELIFSGEYIRANDEEFHGNHFACAICDVSLSKQNFVNHLDTGSICKACYEVKFSHECDKCRRTIGCDSTDVSYGDRHWHEQCFQCSVCSVSLADQLFALADEALFCDQCNVAKNVPRCAGCLAPIEPGSLMTEKDGRRWHEDCVLCDDCRRPLGTGTFVVQDARSICLVCYDAKHGKKCPKCDEIVRAGVSFQGLRYHDRCFQCANCSGGIVDSQYVAKNNGFYCRPCYDRLFSSNCAKCASVISVDTGLKYVKFEDKSWHTICFVCVKCNESLVDKGFLVKDSNIYCTRCGP